MNVLSEIKKLDSATKEAEQKFQQGRQDEAIQMLRELSDKMKELLEAKQA